jgi:excinuclease ABC subunit B
MEIAISETNRRRIKQGKFNLDNNITPQTIIKDIDDIMISTSVADGYKKTDKKTEKDKFKEYLDLDSIDSVIELLKKEMKEASQNLDFEKAAEIRDRIYELKEFS